jgi:hypothetical protein
VVDWHAVPIAIAAALALTGCGDTSHFYETAPVIPAVKSVQVSSFGAIPNDGLDDTDAIRLSAAAIQSAGGGMLIFAPGVYTVFGSTAGILCQFTGLAGVAVLGYGATLEVPTTKAITASEGTFFYFDDCKNITVDGFTTNGPALDVSTTTVKGYEFVHCVHGCRNLSMPGNRVINSLAGLIVSKLLADPDSYRTQNIHVGTLDVVNCWYGINNQFSGDYMQVDNLRTNNVHRSCFIYGASNLVLNINSANHKSTDVPLCASSGIPMENVVLNYHSGLDSVSCGNAGKVQLAFSGPDAGLMRNIRITMSVQYATSGNTGGTALSIRKVDAAGNSDFVDRGHTMDGSVAVGSVRGSCSYIGLGYPVSDFAFDINCLWGPGDSLAIDHSGLVWSAP